MTGWGRWWYSNGRDLGRVLDVLLDGVGSLMSLVDDHGHTLLAMVDLTAEDPDGLGIVDENVVDRREWLVTFDWNESRSETGAHG